MGGLTVSATEFEAKCLDLIEQVSDGHVSRLEVTRDGKVVAVVTAPLSAEDEIRALHGSMRGRVIIPEGFDLTAPVLDEPLDAEAGILHR